MIWNNMKFWPVSSRMISSPSKPRTWRLQLALICLGSADIAGSARWLLLAGASDWFSQATHVKYVSSIYNYIHTIPLPKKTMGQLNAPFSKMRSFPKKTCLYPFLRPFKKIILLLQLLEFSRFWVKFIKLSHYLEVDPILTSFYLLVT